MELFVSAVASAFALAGYSVTRGLLQRLACHAKARQGEGGRLRRKCQRCAHYPVHGSFPAVCAGCRKCSKWKEGA